MLNKKCFVLDLDGTVYLGDIPIQETVDFILRHWDTIDFHFLSNNTSKAPTTYVNKLTRMGIPATLDRILSPVTPLIAHLRGNGIRTVYPVGNRDFVACLRERMPELNVLDYGVSEGAFDLLQGPMPPSGRFRAAQCAAPTEIGKRLRIRRSPEPHLSPTTTKARFQPGEETPKGCWKLSGSGDRPETNPMSTRAFAMTAKAA